MHTIEDYLGIHYRRAYVKRFYYLDIKMKILLAQRLEETFADALTLPSAGIERALLEIFCETLREVQACTS